MSLSSLSVVIPTGGRDQLPEQLNWPTTTTAAMPAETTTAAALDHMLAEHKVSSPTARGNSRLQQQQQEIMEPVFRPSSARSISFAGNQSAAADGSQEQQSAAASAAVAAAAEDIAAGQASGTAVHDNAAAAALIATVLQKSRASSPQPSAAGGTAVARSNSRRHESFAAAEPSLHQQQGWEQQVVHGSATRGTSMIPQPERSASSSVSGSLNGSSKMDRASLVAAVLEKHRAKQAGETGASAGFAFNSTGSGDGGMHDRPSSAAGSGRNSAASSMTGGKDRASIVAAVLAQRQSQRSASGDTAAAGGRSNARLPGSASARGDFAGLGAAGTSSGAGGSRMSSVDRESLVAAVLAKHHLRPNKSFASS